MCTRFAPGVLLSFTLWLTACSAAPAQSSQGPTAVVLGETTLLVVVSPFVGNRVCGAVAITGTNLTFLGNAGLAPLPAPAGGCRHEPEADAKLPCRETVLR